MGVNHYPGRAWSGRSGRAAPDRVDRALDSRRLHLRAARDRPRLRRRARLDAVIAVPGRRRVGQRLLGPDPVHAADVAHHHHRPRARDVGADGEGDSRDRRLGGDAARRRRARHVLRARDIVVQLGLQPGVQRRARARSGAACDGRRLSRAGGGEHARHRQHLGAGAQRIGGAADGDARARCSRRFATSSRPAASSPAASFHSATRSSSGRASSRCWSRSSSSCW